MLYRCRSSVVLYVAVDIVSKSFYFLFSPGCHCHPAKIYSLICMYLSHVSAVTDSDTSSVNISYRVMSLRAGHISFANMPTTPITKFTQADVNNNLIIFVHSGKSSLSHEKILKNCNDCLLEHPCKFHNFTCYRHFGVWSSGSCGF